MGRPKAYGYIRVSTAGQADNTSPEVQMSSIDAYFRWSLAATHDWGGFYRDLGVTGSSPLRERPQGKLLWAIMETGDSVIFSRLDRGFRDAVDCALTCREWLGKGIAAHFLDLRVDTSTSIGEMFLGILSYVVQYFRKVLRERTQEGKARRYAEGKVAYGKPRYGFIFNGRKGKLHLQSDPRQRLLGGYIVELYDAHNLTFAQVWLRLREERKINPVTKEYLGQAAVKKWYYCEKELRKLEREGAFNGTTDHQWYKAKKIRHPSSSNQCLPSRRKRRPSRRLLNPPPEPGNRTDGSAGKPADGQGYGAYQG